MLKVSVIIPTFNRCKLVKRILTSLLKQSFEPSDFEVIVSIDGSHDGTEEMIYKFDSKYRLRHVWGQNAGKPFACDRAIEQADGSIIIVDDDKEPSSGFVHAHYFLHQKAANIAVFGSAPITITESPSPIVRYIGKKFNDDLKKISKPGYKIRIWNLYDGNFSIRRDLFVRMGLYNNSINLYRHGEVELAHRFKNERVSIIFSEEALCVQHYEKDFRNLTEDRIGEGKTAVQLVNLYPETFPELKLREYNTVGWKWRALRLSLIHITSIFSLVHDLIVMIINAIEKLAPSRVSYLYDFTLDYFFWFGVWTALKNDSRNEKLKSQIKSYQYT